MLQNTLAKVKVPFPFLVKDYFMFNKFFVFLFLIKNKKSLLTAQHKRVGVFLTKKLVNFESV